MDTRGTTPPAVHSVALQLLDQITSMQHSKQPGFRSSLQRRWPKA